MLVNRRRHATPEKIEETKEAAQRAKQQTDAKAKAVRATQKVQAAVWVHR
ncbi:hypothetical protein AGMMS49593_05130 [Endomicrobiia bacterium]|nr:hypothetical protein AGMMS49593_05130 [Endomicrobiia bacterium]